MLSKRAIRFQRTQVTSRQVNGSTAGQRRAEPRLCSDPGFELAPVSKRDPTIKGGGFAVWLGQGVHHALQPVRQMRCAAVLVAKQDRKACLALDQQRDVRFDLCAPENHQITFPFTIFRRVSTSCGITPRHQWVIDHLRNQCRRSRAALSGHLRRFSLKVRGLSRQSRVPRRDGARK